MSIHASIHHVTHYRYEKPVTMGPQLIRLRPAPHSRTNVLSYALKIEPAKHFLNWQQDSFGNWLARVVLPEPVTEFKVTVDCVADMAVYNPFDFFIEEYAEHFPFRYLPELRKDLRPYMRKVPVGTQFKALLAKLPVEKVRMVDFLVALNARIQHEVSYTIRMEPGVQTPEETLKKASGSCRDSGWLLVQLLRHLGYAARFVSGYLIQLTPDQKSLDGPSGTEVDFTDLHAWCEVYLPGAGWVGLDPTSGLFCGEGHIPLCATPEPSTAAPVSGGFTYARGEDDPPMEIEFGHEMKVTRLRETPRITKPYTEEQWTAIDMLGATVDTRLAAGDVRLTMGGEPTFISIDDFQAPEWNTAAVGPTKQKLANDLLLRLRQQFAPGALLTHGQGKWYPGEQLPRWAYAMYWRKDMEPILRANVIESTVPAYDKPTSLTDGTRQHAERVKSAGLLIRGIAARLSVNPDNALPAYEDAFYYLHRERQLPPNVSALDSKLKDEEERARLAQIFERGLEVPRGYVLPVQRWQTKAWVSELWKPRTGRLQLMPGDSPAGFRLPLESLPHVDPKDYPHQHEADPFSLRAALPSRYSQPFLQLPQVEREQRLAKQRLLTDELLAAKSEAQYLQGTVRTAMSVEPRGDHLYVFMPPAANADDFLELIAAVEDTAAELQVPVRIEGYPPPNDPRLEVLKITPDPGVIEVNVQPASSWLELKHIVNTVYDEARLSRLTTEKFLVDGRSVGSGGGAHIVIGGATPADSPFLRRPDMLGSLVRFWQNHPSLSYFFSGLFIGPTSQHPRVDEARDANLYELEIALAQLPRKGAQVPLWIVDRILRHLLTDLTGNTHRSEICIDKLYSPDSATGRLGLVEFRGFEMPPHARMNLAQQLLLRALVAKFWETPYEGELVRWGTALHDRFLLPHFLWNDLTSVLDELRRSGFAFDNAWFAPHFEFRFPAHGTVRYGDVEIELRHALECWNTLGEEPGGGGTARYVDSSLERLQVKVTGLTQGRHFITVAGRRMPLTPTGTQGEYVAGLRYRAWQPASCLHPTIGVHTPLVFDLYDAWAQRAVAGCTYHVMHPAGRSYDTFPINSYEAEARRLARFSPMGHTPGNYWPADEKLNAEYPLTLDLRR
ncbi:MAG: transglutaminase family protein [Pseudomonadota bacterium]